MSLTQKSTKIIECLWIPFKLKLRKKIIIIHMSIKINNIKLNIVNDTHNLLLVYVMLPTIMTHVNFIFRNKDLY